MKIVGLTGYGQSGKDEVGRIMVERGWTRFAKGDLLKDAAYAINPHVVLVEDVAVGQGRTITDLRHLVDSVGWEEAKSHDAVRRFLQDMADEVVGVCGRDVWNEALYESILKWARERKRDGKPEKVVLTRLSLPYEVDMLRSHGGYLIRVNRLDHGPANDHPNEVALDAYEADWTLFNDGTLDDLAHDVDVMLDGLGLR